MQSMREAKLRIAAAVFVFMGSSVRFPPGRPQPLLISPMRNTTRLPRSQNSGRSAKRPFGGFTTAMLAVALSKLNGEQWWIEIETVPTPTQQSLGSPFGSPGL